MSKSERNATNAFPSEKRYRSGLLYVEDSIELIWEDYRTHTKNRQYGGVSLVRNKREESHEPRTFDRFGKRALVLGGEPRALAREDAAVGVQEPSQVIDIFVVDVTDVVCVEIVLFVHSVSFKM